MAVFNKILAPILLVFFSAPISHADVVDRVVAVVNNDVITLSEINQEGKALLQRVAENVSPEELPEALKEARKTIIGNLIDKKIMMQEAEKEEEEEMKDL